MSEPRLTWNDVIQQSIEQNLPAKQLYFVRSKPTHGLGPVKQFAEVHIDYQRKLEADGVMFAAGPISGTDEHQWHGEGIFIYRAASLAEADSIAAADPMHINGARDYEIRAWLLNEGKLFVELDYSGGTAKVT